MHKIIHLTLALQVLMLPMVSLSCESEAERQDRAARLERQKMERQAQLERERAAEARRLEQERIEREARLERERKEREIYDRYIKNSLRTGSTPYANCFGSNRSCDEWGCSKIIVRTPHNSDVLVTIKRNGEVYRHAYIRAGSSYSFEMPNGTYQPFFYYGKGWNPNKSMESASCPSLKGGFISREHFGKDSPQSLTNNVLTYELILQQNGNFSQRPSSSSEAL